MQTKIEVEKGHYVSCAVFKKIDPLKILHVLKLPIYSDTAHRDESNGLITGKNNTTRVVRFFHPTLQLLDDHSLHMRGRHSFWQAGVSLSFYALVNFYCS